MSCALFAVVLIVTSCAKGKWPPIRLDKQEITFPATGGSEEIMALNYDYLSLAFGSEGEKDVDGKSEWINYSPAYPSGDGGWIIDGDWYKIVAPFLKDNPNVIFVTVEPNTTSNPRQALIFVACYDAGGSFIIRQE